MTDKSSLDGLLKHIEKVSKKTGYDDVFINVLRYHLEVLLNSNEVDDIKSRQEMICYLFSRMFIDTIDMYPTQHFECEIDENSDCWPLEPLPSEFFGENPDDSLRKQWFYLSLNIYDVLDCSVKSGSMPTYKLRVIHKYGVTRVLDDLELTVVFSPTKTEVQLLEKELHHNDHVRVAVCKVDKEKNETIIHVTIDSDNIAHFKPLPKLGRITEDDLPDYVLEHPDTEKYASYSDYLNNKSQFLNSYFYDDLFRGFGINSKKVCTYYLKLLDSQKYPDGQAILNESKLADAKLLANAALNCKSRDGGLSYIEESLKVCPKTDEMLGRLYDIKYDINVKQQRYSCANRSLEKAFKLKPDDEDIKRKMLACVFKSAYIFYKDKNYKEALRGCEYILRYDEQNYAAKTLMNHLKTKYADHVTNLEDKSINDLKERKKVLLTELKKCPN